MTFGKTALRCWLPAAALLLALLCPLPVAAVPLGTHDADEGHALGCLAAVVDDIGHFGLQTALHKVKGDAFHQLFQFHT